MANTHHTGIPKLQWSFEYPPCTPSVTIVADKNPFCAGYSVTFTPTFNCVEDITITAYGWVVNGTIQSTSSEPFVSNTLTNNDTVYLLIVTNNGQTYFSNVIHMQEKTEGCITLIKYGLLYNWYAATDERNITSAGDFVVPTFEMWQTLREYVTELIGGGILKETGIIYWDTPNTGAINEVGFNARGSGLRAIELGFLGIKQIVYYITTTLEEGMPVIFEMFYNSEQLNMSNVSNDGVSIRLVRPATPAELLLADGSACANYVGNDGKVYRTVKIGTQVWLADNLAETKYRNGEYIHGYEGGVYTPISNEDWAALTTAGLCVYEDDLNNM